MLKSVIKTALLFSLSFAIFACQKSQDPMAARGITFAGNIMGGSNLDLKSQSKDGVVGLLLVGADAQGQQTTAICTGSLISQNVVLSAGHCVLSTPDSTLKAIFVVFSTDIKSVIPEITSNKMVHVRAADAIIQHEGFGFDQKTKFVLNDLSLIRFKDAAPVGFQLAHMPDPDQFSNLQVGTKLTLEGYGVVSYNLDPKTQKPVGDGAGTLRQIDDRAIAQVTDDQSKIILNQTDNKGACHGDSGGPAYYVDPLTKQKFLVGVTSQAYRLDQTSKDNPLCNQLNVYTNLGHYLDWIKTNLAKIESK